MASASPPASVLLRARPRRLSLPHPAAAAARPTLDGSQGLRRAPRRLFLGIGASFLDQFARMASGSGGRSFVASARPQRGVSPVEQILKNVVWPETFPFKDEDFNRFDESPDSLFYSEPRFVTHIDDPAIRALTKYYSEVFPPSNSSGVCLLDLCSSWVSHYPAGYMQDRIVGMGMNEEELKRNPVLTEYIVQDLNINPKLPFVDNTFDVITNVVSVDYLTKPIDVFKEMQRILKPGGLAIMSFSNRCFWTKAISIWTSTGDADHVWIVGAYFHYAGGFEPPIVCPLVLWTYLPTLGVQTRCMLYTPESRWLTNDLFFEKVLLNLRKKVTKGSNAVAVEE
ncbi:ubiE/COQ5 methyltransferase family [Musa troglodytarum]|uniref:UbiE/COQ5 methyltransferase family n=1 Tax=Musa troglodytarum TaxID=320322 RepID=A0A9E7KEI6_9LILI|nr:ubiE/COQ5 methyltransferase family [Musa troglodytarum]